MIGHGSRLEYRRRVEAFAQASEDRATRALVAADYLAFPCGYWHHVSEDCPLEDQC